MFCGLLLRIIAPTTAQPPLVASMAKFASLAEASSCPLNVRSVNSTCDYGSQLLLYPSLANPGVQEAAVTGG